ncbi:MAG: hypothetical protein ACFCU6_06915 [Balneolaceae bacterium]
MQNNSNKRFIKAVLGLIKIGYWTIFTLTIFMFGSPFLTALLFSGATVEILPSMNDPEYILMSISGFLHCALYFLVAAVLYIIHEIATKILLEDQSLSSGMASSV